ncbi:MAG: hypothetical protein JXA82_16475 [Sedimentisphaerales bacterium]|nr:hypothetical protein [Sedimentisphaerales bacterium]
MSDVEKVLRPCRKRIRFKFMPTPSGPLHIGHAWLLILMDCLVKRAQQEGRDADIVLVLDELTYRHSDEEKRQETAKSIIENARWLGIEFSHIVSNYVFPYESSQQPKPMKCHSCNQYAPKTLFTPNLNTIYSGSSYFLKNCAIDAALEITHVIRGEDQLGRASVYTTFYELLEMPSPRLVYLPFVCKADGGKIRATDDYTIDAVQKGLAREAFIPIVISKCIQNVPKNPDDANESLSIQEAEKQLFGEDWDWVLGNADSPAKLASFLSRLETKPRISSEELVQEYQNTASE